MALPSRDQFGRLLRGLSREAFASFVADLWSARGYAVEIEDDAVIAVREEPTAERRVLLVRHTAPRLSRPDWTTDRSGPADVVTSSPETERAREFARSLGGTLVDGGDLYEMALYAVGARARRALFEEHFCRSPTGFERSEEAKPPPVVEAVGRLAAPRALALVGIGLLVVAAGMAASPGTLSASDAGASTTATPDTSPFEEISPAALTGTPVRDQVRAAFAGSGPPASRATGTLRHGVGEDAWPMFRGGPTHTGRNADVTEPLSGPTLMATFDAETDVVSSPAVVNDTVYVGATDGGIYALDPTTLSRKWARGIGASVRSSPAVAGGTVYAGAIGSSAVRTRRLFVALSAENGSIRFRAPTGSIAFSSPTVADDTLYVGAADGTIYALDAANGSIVWRVRTDGSVLSSPAVANGTVYVGSNDGNVYAIDAAAGEIRWTAGTGGEVMSSPAVANETVYVGSMDGSVYAIDATTGDVRWTVETGDSVFSSPAVAGGTVYVGSNDGNVHAIDAATGEVRWGAETNGSIVSSPAVVGRAVYVGSMEGAVYSFDAATGRTRWRFETGASVASSPAVADGVLYVGSSDGKVYALWIRIIPNYPVG